MGVNIISVAEAAKILGKSPQFIRMYMDMGMLPIGRVVSRPGGQRKTYLIYRHLVEKEMGVEKG